MPKSVDYDLSQINAHIIAYSDRIQRGTKEDRATPACVGALTTAGLDQVTMAAIPESADVLDTEIREALAAGARFILILGGSGFGVGNYAPEVVRSIIEVEIPGIAEQIRAHGLTNTPPVRPVPRGRRRDRTRFLGSAHHLLPRLAWRRARHPRGGHAPTARDLPPARRAALTLPSNKKRGHGSLVSGGGGEAWPGFGIDHSEP